MAESIVELPIEGIAALARKYGVRRLALFGSALGDEFGPASDLDFLVEFQNDDYGPWMGKMTDLREELARLLNREVDLVSRRGIERSRNWIRRERILGSAKVIYEE
jgi:hypothetical protein